MECDDDHFLFHAHPSYQGKPWYDWTFVEYAEKDKDYNDCSIHYPSLVLGFVQLPGDDEISAVVGTFIKPMT